MRKTAPKPMELPELDQLRREYRHVRLRSRYLALLKSTAGTLLVTAAAVVLAANLWLPVLKIVGSSMSPTLEAGDILVCAANAEPRSGQLTAFYLGNRLLVKRCVAEPGQWVDIDEQGTLMVDGTAREDPWGMVLSGDSEETAFPCRVPGEAWFCLGDNRELSVDSRHKAVGFVTRTQILGRPLLRIWPLDRFGPVQ